MNLFEISVETAQGELTALNNLLALPIDGVREKLRVLLVSGEPHAGERTWRNLLKADPNVDLVHFTILRPPEKQDGTPTNELSLIAFPTRELFVTKIAEFDLIIFDRYSNQTFLPTLYFENMVRYVREGGAILFAVIKSTAIKAARGVGHETKKRQRLPCLGGSCRSEKISPLPRSLFKYDSGRPKVAAQAARKFGDIRPLVTTGKLLAGEHAEVIHKHIDGSQSVTPVVRLQSLECRLDGAPVERVQRFMPPTFFEALDERTAWKARRVGINSFGGWHRSDYAYADPRASKSTSVMSPESGSA
jgi:hypothetical protein